MISLLKNSKLKKYTMMFGVVVFTVGLSSYHHTPSTSKRRLVAERVRSGLKPFQGKIQNCMKNGNVNHKRKNDYLNSWLISREGYPERIQIDRKLPRDARLCLEEVILLSRYSESDNLELVEFRL